MAPKMSGIKHFLDLDRFETATLREMIEWGKGFKRGQAPGGEAQPFAGKALAMVFEKPSTRTRVSFERAIRQLGGDAIVFDSESIQLGRRESVADTARVLSRYVDAIMVRTTSEAKLLEMAEHATVPVINGLTDRTHPCQLMADVLTFEEHRGPIEGRVVAWSGDGNNVATSWIHAAVRFGFEIRLACPESMAPDPAVLAWADENGGRVLLAGDARAAADGADCVVTDTWVSMGAEPGANHQALLEPYRVDAALMARAKPDALFMHCLPAHRGEEVTAEVIDGPQSVVWDEAGNRLHAQKSILNWCLA